MGRNDIKLVDLILDQSFQEYVILGTPESKLVWDNWIEKNQDKSGIVEEAEQIILFQYKNKVVQKHEQLGEEVLNKLNERIEKTRKNLRSQRRLALMKIAAIFLIFLSVAGILMFKYSNVHKVKYEYVEVYAKKGERLKITLPDSSHVWINSGATLKYPFEFENSERLVYLKGEAYFDVKHSNTSPFIVQVDQDLKVRVLGTEFNIKLDTIKQFFETTLFNGSVKIYCTNKSDNTIEETILQPNEKAFVLLDDMDSGIQKRRLSDSEMDMVSSWKRNILIFKDEKFSEIASRLENWFGINIKISNNELLNERFTGCFSEQENIYEVLEVFNKTEDINYKFINGDLIIY